MRTFESINDWNENAIKYISCEKEDFKDLLNYVDENTFRAISKRLKLMCGKFKNKLSDEGVERLYDITKAVHIKILENIKPDDLPSMVLLGQLFAKEGNYNLAEKYLKRALVLPNSENALMTLLHVYERRISGMYMENPDNPQINILAEELRNMYEEQLEIMRKTDSLYVKTAFGYARLEKQCHRHEHAISILNSITIDFDNPDMYRLLLEKGLIYQACHDNPYYNLNRSIECLKGAKELYENTTEKIDYRAYLSVLGPLANSLYYAGKYQECVDICNLALRYSKHDKNILSRLNKALKKIEQKKAA